MSIELNIPVGTKGMATLVVGAEHTASHVGSGKIRVLATPVMINLFEAAALAACEHLLPTGHQSLGTRLDVTHTAATPIGMCVTAEAEVVSVSGRTIQFRLVARDLTEIIGKGQHERVVVNAEKFALRVAQKSVAQEATFAKT